jgi:hypothetical protein
VLFLLNKKHVMKDTLDKRIKDWYFFGTALGIARNRTQLQVGGL